MSSSPLLVTLQIDYATCQFQTLIQVRQTIVRSAFVVGFQTRDPKSDERVLCIQSQSTHMRFRVFALLLFIPQPIAFGALESGRLVALECASSI